MQRRRIEYKDIDPDEDILWMERYEAEIDNHLIGGSACGYPQRVLDYGGPVAVYQDCIEKKVTWRKLLGYKEHIYDGSTIWN